MNLVDFRYRDNDHLKETSLVLLVRPGQLLLAMKKRGFGAGYWNGPGGKLLPGETVYEAAVRETMEEVGVEVSDLTEVARLTFYFDDDPTDPIQNIHTTVYLGKTWTGEPEESEEMMPQWFHLADIPYNAMWADDRYWLPHVLDGAYVEAEFLFSTDNTLREMDVRPRRR